MIYYIFIYCKYVSLGIQNKITVVSLKNKTFPYVPGLKAGPTCACEVCTM